MNMPIWMLNCNDVAKKVSESMDRTLPLHQRMMITMHLLMCKYCHRFKQQLLIIRNAMRLNDLLEGEPDHSQILPTEARYRIKQAMQDFLSRSE